MTAAPASAAISPHQQLFSLEKTATGCHHDEVSCHLCAYGSEWLPNQPNPPQINPTAGSVGICERCYALACPKHGSRPSTNEVRFYCADCDGRQALVTGTSGPPPPPPQRPGPPGSGGGGAGTGPPRPDSPESQPGGGASTGLAAELARHPDSVRWALPALSPAISRLRELFDREELASALDHVVDDHRGHEPAEIGRAFGARVLAALHEQDEQTLMRVLALFPEDPQLATDDRDARRGVLEDMASARAGALARELALEASELRPFPPQPPTTSATGIPIDDIALIQNGLTALCAAHGYEPEGVHVGTLASPLDLPGALSLPAYALQVLFAYVDRGGLGRHFEMPGPSPFGSTDSDTANEVPAEFVYARA
jgi:hypothetical protein